MLEYRSKVTQGIVCILFLGVSLCCTNSQRSTLGYEDYPNTQPPYKETASLTTDSPQPALNNQSLYSDIQKGQNTLNSNVELSRGSNSDMPAVDSNIITCTISANAVNLRNYPDTSSDVIKSIDKGENVNIISRWNEWYKIKTSGNAVGWVRKDLITINTSASNENDTIQKIPVEKPKEIVPAGQKLVNYSKKFLGVKYVWGGITPKGFDCSGFVKYVYSQFGISLERVAADQAKHGTKVNRNNLRPGDLVFFDTDGGHSYINHVGIYIGNGQFIEASSGYSTHKVVISSLYDGFYSDAYMTARRLF